MTDVDDLYDLYGVAPEEFLARRKELVAAAKKRGDGAAAKQIGAARRPTTAAWVVNALVRADDTSRDRLADLGERLRAAHAAMDGTRIRELSMEQRKLIDELVRAGFSAAGLAQPSGALRDEVVGALQATIADPDVAVRLGRLEKAERWSGFGEFGSVTTTGPAVKSKRAPASAPKAETPDRSAEARDAELAAAKERRSTAASEGESAERAHAEAVDRVSERQAELSRARRHYEKLLKSLDAAEQALNTADERSEAAEQASREVAGRSAVAASTLAAADAELARLTSE